MSRFGAPLPPPRPVERRQSRPDSDPAALKSQIIDHRFDAVHERIDGIDERVGGLSEKLDDLASSLATTALEVAKGTATLKAWLAAVVLFLTIINVAAAVLGKLMSH